MTNNKQPGIDHVRRGRGPAWSALSISQEIPQCCLIIEEITLNPQETRQEYRFYQPRRPHPAEQATEESCTYRCCAYDDIYQYNV